VTRAQKAAPKEASPQKASQNQNATGRIPRRNESGRTQLDRIQRATSAGRTKKARITVAVLAVGDIVVTGIAIALVTAIPWVTIGGMVAALLTFSGSMVAGQYLAGAYRADSFYNVRGLTISASNGLMLSILLTGAAELLWPGSLLDTSVIVGFYLFALPLVLASRFAGMRRARAGFDPEAVAIVGSDADAHELIRVLASTSSFRLAMTISPMSATAVRVSRNGGDPVRTPMHRLSSVLLDSSVALIAVADHGKKNGNSLRRQLRLCRSRGVDIQDVSTCIEMMTQRVPVRLVREWRTPSVAFPGWGRTFDDKIKRLGDIVLSLAIMVLIAPIIAIVAAVIRLVDGAPVLYTQQRVGAEGRDFTMYKFRSMRADAERDGPVWAEENDPRVTRLGTFLRKFHLDELPQLWNVFRGDMSLVGPRPERPEFVQWLRLAIPHYDVRHTTRPGITGWAQVRYPYGASVEEAEAKLEYDLYYVRHRHVLWDLYIIVSTVAVVLKRRDR